jgi:hypothetical protein
MESNDISFFVPIQQICMFEGVLAHPPIKKIAKLRAARMKAKGDWKAYIGMWEPYELPLKSIIDSVRRRGIGVDVVTLMGDEAAEAIDSWLFKRAASVPVLGYSSMRDFSDSVKYHNPSTVIHVGTEEQARIVGIRARVASPEREMVL